MQLGPDEGLECQRRFFAQLGEFDAHESWSRDRFAAGILALDAHDSSGGLELHAADRYDKLALCVYWWSDFGLDQHSREADLVNGKFGFEAQVRRALGFDAEAAEQAIFEAEDGILVNKGPQFVGLAAHDVGEMDTGSKDRLYLAPPVPGRLDQSAPDDGAFERHVVGALVESERVLAPYLERAVGLDRHAIETQVEDAGTGREQKTAVDPFDLVAGIGPAFVGHFFSEDRRREPILNTGRIVFPRKRSMSDRKYRQRGYEDDREAARQFVPESGNRPQARPRQEARGGPRGRGLGAPKKSVLKCARCGAPVGSVPDHEDSCKSCGSDLHTCTNCRHFDSAALNECRQPVEIRVTAKAKKNECGFFEPKWLQEFASDVAPGGTKPDARDAKTAFDELFDF